MKIIALAAILSLVCCSKTEFPQSGETPKPPAAEQPNDPEQPTNKSMKITTGGFEFTAALADNATAEAFTAMLPLTLTMNDFNDNEKVCSLPGSLPTAASSWGIIRSGDIMLYGSNSIVLFYQTFSSSYSYTRIGTVDNPSGLEAALGSGSVTIKFEMQ